MKIGDKLTVRKVLLISKLALISVLGYAVVETVAMPGRTNEIFAPRSAVAIEDMLPISPKGSAGNPTQDYSIIVDRNIFAAADLPCPAGKGAKTLKTADPLEADKGDLGLELVGTVVGNNSLSRAVIRDIMTNVTGLYKTNDTIAGASIDGIEENRVLLTKKGRTRILVIGSTVSEPADIALLKSASSNNKPPAGDAVEASGTVEPEPVVRTKLKYIETILRKAVVEPYVVADQMQGLRITGLENVPFAKGIGLRNGDVIRTVNGQSLTSKQKAYQIFKKARSKSTMQVELMRGSATKTLVLDLR